MGYITNHSGIPLALAVWLLHDEYDYVDKPNYISATTLLKPIRQIILPSRIPVDEREEDVEDYIARALGKTIHDSIEKSWLKGYRRSMKLLGHPEAVIDRVKVNPEPEELKSGDIPVYIEQRMFAEINGWTIGGKYDMVTDGVVNDTKSTSAWSYVYGGNDEDHQLQGSIYRWLDSKQPHRKITEDHMQINYVFTDWQKSMARQNQNYPQKRVADKRIPLLSLDETEKFITDKLALIERLKNVPEYQLPECTDKELWRSDPKYKYFSDPAKTSGRSTKNFTSAMEANAYVAEKGKGVVITELGEPKRCGYCAAYEACTQKDAYFND